MKRAYSLLEIKSFDEAEGIIEGIATTPTTDRAGDIVEPKGAQFQLPIPLLWQHDSSMPIGKVFAAKVTSAGIEVKARIERGLLPEIDRAWTLIKGGLVRGLSIGFKPIKAEDLKGFAQRFTEWEWLELSAVTIPANSEASISLIKSLCGPAIGSAVVRINSPGASGISIERKEKDMTTQERITQWQAKRAATQAALTAIMKTAEDDGDRTLTSEEKADYDAKGVELGEIDDHLKRLDTQLKTVAATATAVVENKADKSTTTTSSTKGDDGVIRRNSALPPGIEMARYVKAFAFAKGNYQQAAEYAKQWETSTPEVAIALKSAIGAGTTTDSAWAGPLVYNQDFPAAFLDYLRPQTILGKLEGLSRVPFNIRYGIQDGGSTVAWVGQGLGKPVSKLHFTSGSLGFAKAAGIVVITQELARFSSPSAELKVRDDLTNQMAQFLDAQFIDPGVAAVANVSPASILNGASNVRQAAAAWTSMANVLTDVKVLLSTFAANEISLQGGYWIMTPDTALSLGLLLNTGGTAFAFPEVNVNGGTFLGLPVIVSNSVPHSVSAGAIVALVVPKHIYVADDGQVAIDTSQEASLQMDSAPTQDSGTPTASTMVSMFQTNSIAVRAERIINWSRARNYGVGYIDNMHTS